MPPAIPGACACTHAWVHTYTHMHMYAHKYTHPHTYTCTCVHTHNHTPMHIYTQIHTPTNTYTCTPTHVYVHKHIHKCTYTLTRPHIHAHDKHTGIYTFMQACADTCMHAHTYRSTHVQTRKHTPHRTGRHGALTQRHQESVETRTPRSTLGGRSPGPRRKEAPRAKDGRGQRAALTGPQAHGPPGGGRGPRAPHPPSRRPLNHPFPTPAASTAVGLDGLAEHELPLRLGARPSLRLKSKCPGANLLGSKRAPPLPPWDPGRATELRSHLLLCKLQVKTAPTLWATEKSQRDSLCVFRTGPTQESRGLFLVLPHLH